MNKSKRLDQLVASVENLLARLPDNLHPEIAALRERVDAEILDAWTTISRQARSLRPLNGAASRPAVLVGVALLAAASLLASRMVLSRHFKHR